MIKERVGAGKVTEARKARFNASNWSGEKMGEKAKVGADSSWTIRGGRDERERG